MEVRVRIPPSPTGRMHLGTAYTALFNYLFARKNKGIYIFRWEDTDRERSKKEFEEDIESSMLWLGLKWDEGPFRQMDRLASYRSATEKLLNEGKAFYCFCTTDELEEVRKKQQAESKPQVYRGKCRSLTRDEINKFKAEGKRYVIRFKMPDGRGKIIFDDLVHGRIEFDSNLIGDIVIMRANGVPLYNFAVVVDDTDMKITHVLRGEDHISNTPKQIVLFEALGATLPQFAHFPNILNTDRIGKLSKREGSTAVSDYLKEGYLPEAITNYLSIIGWTHPEEKEIMTMDEMIAGFELGRVRKSPAAFNISKLDWLNGEYIRKMTDEQLTKRLQGFLVDHPSKDKIAPVVPFIKERIKKLSDFVPLTDFLWEKVEYDIEIFNGLKIKDLRLTIEKVLESLENIDRPWKSEVFESTFRELAEKFGLSTKQMFQLIRAAISGQLVTPPLFESIKILGEEETIKRVKDAIGFLQSTKGLF